MTSDEDKVRARGYAAAYRRRRMAKLHKLRLSWRRKRLSPEWQIKLGMAPR